MATDSVSSFRVIGLCAATFTPFASDGSLNNDAVVAHLEALQRGGVTSVFVGGTTGESLSLTMEERRAHLEAWVAASKDTDVTVIAHVGCESLADTIELAKHAEEAGAAAIGLMPSVFFKPTFEALVRWLEQVGATCSLPMYYYHIAIMTGVDFNMVKLLEAVDGRIPTFRGIKFTDFNLHAYASCVAFKDGKYDILYGRDEQMLGALCMGAQGFVGSTYNYDGAVYNKVIEAFKAGDMEGALKHQRRAQRCIDLLGSSKYGSGVYPGKAMLQLSGVPIGDPRLPKLPMTADAVALLREDLTELGFFE